MNQNYDPLIIAVSLLMQDYEQDLSFVALEMTKTLVETFHQVFQIEENGEEEFQTDLVCLLTINKILTAIFAQNKHEIVSKLEQTLINTIVKIFEQCTCRFKYKVATVILSQLTKYSISQESWRAFKPLCVAFQRYSVEYSMKMMAIISNYITLDTQTFTGSMSNMAVVYDTCQSILSKLDLDEKSHIYAAQLVLTVTKELINRNDVRPPPFIELIITRLNQEIKTDELKSQLLDVVNVVACNNYHQEQYSKSLESIIHNSTVKRKECCERVEEDVLFWCQK